MININSGEVHRKIEQKQKKIKDKNLYEILDNKIENEMHKQHIDYHTYEK
jgi:hypothetical protein